MTMVKERISSTPICECCGAVYTVSGCVRGWPCTCPRLEVWCVHCGKCRQHCACQGEPGLRCRHTGNPCGTDTWAQAHSCPCAACQAYLELRQLQRAYARLSQDAWIVVATVARGEGGQTSLQLRDALHRLGDTLRASSEHCACTPPGSGEEYCMGHCVYAPRQDEEAML